MKISIRNLLTLITVIVCSCALIAGGVFWYASQSSHETTEALVHAIESVAVAQNVQVGLAAHRRQGLLNGLRSIKERQANIARSEAQLLRGIGELPQFTTGPEDEILIGKVKQGVLQYLESYRSLRRAGLAGTPLYKQLTEDYDLAQNNIHELVSLNLHKIKKIEQDVLSKGAVNSVLMTGALLLLVVVTVSLLIGFRYLFFQPILVLKKRIDQFELGNPLQEVKVNGSSEIRSIYHSFTALAQRLSKQKEQQLTFLSSIAHDLKNPLAAIKMSTDLLAEEDGLTKTHLELLSVIGRQSDHLKRLVNDLLDTTRIESGHMELRKSPCDLRKIVLDSVLLHRNLSDQHVIETRAPNNPIMILGDSERITQVIHNLLNNAIKYSPHGGKIQVEITSQDSSASVSVSDSGVGILPEDLENIFRPFHRSSATRNSIPGVGLGLSVSRKIISGHQGGEIHVSSLPGQGSTFTLKLATLTLGDQSKLEIPPISLKFPRDGDLSLN